MNFFRNPNFAFTFSLLMLVFSCTQYEINNSRRAFDYSLFESYLDNIDDVSISNNGNSFRIDTTIESNKQILNQINEQYGSELQIPDILLGFSDYTSEEMKDIALNEGYINDKDIELIDQFVLDVKDYEYETALYNFEDSVLNILNISEEEFDKYNKYANFFETLKYESPEIFEKAEAGLLARLLAIVVWIAALIGFIVGCATVFLCFLAAIALMAATVDVVQECVLDTPNSPQLNKHI